MFGIIICAKCMILSQSLALANQTALEEEKRGYC